MTYEAASWAIPMIAGGLWLGAMAIIIAFGQHNA